MDVLEAGARKLDRIERAERLDPPVNVLRGLVGRLPQPVLDALHGRWLGHPLHPALTDVPIGAWLAAAVLDGLPGQERAATAMVGLGLAGAAPAAASGAADWAQASREQERLGIWHWLANTTAVALYAGSLAARLTGRHRTGRALGTAGLAAVSAGAYLGGHLAYRSGTGMNHAMAAWRRLPRGWYVVDELAELPVGKLVRRHIGDVALLVYRGPRTVRVLVDQCTHLAGPLSEGRVTSEADVTVIDDDACVVCPWHGSTYRLSDGMVRRGPATMSQPVLRVRLVDGRVEACR
jgi:nitrite reductase/ring-hydroxylating ferredoxin subunit